MPVPFRPERRLSRIAQMPTAELLDRVTVLKELMDEDALELMQAELAGRGIGPDEIGAHLRDMRFKLVKHTDGTAAICMKCGRAATGTANGWHRLWGLVPLFKRREYWCDEHAPARASVDHDRSQR
jgi:hypothetical protein